jgi:hypothetical protein
MAYTMNYHTYATRKEAQQAANNFQRAKPVKLQLPNPTNPQELRDTWVIQIDGDKYFRRDGYVR